MMMSTAMKREIPLVMVTVLGIIMVLDYYVTIPAINAMASTFQEWTAIVFGFAMCLGAVSLFRYNLKMLIQKTPGKWWFALCTISAFSITLISGLIGPWTTHWVFSWMYNYTYVPPAGTLYGMLSFYILSAGYRAVKVRNIESAAFAICAWFMIMKNAPIAQTIWIGFFNIGDWISKIPSAAGWRAFYIGAAIGTVALGIRTFIWRERGLVGE